MEAATRQFDFAEVLTRMAEERASDVHLSPGFPPAIRVKGQITPLNEYGRLSAQATRDTVYGLLNDDQRKRFESNKQLDLAYAVPGVARFRVNTFFQRGSISAAFRRIPHQIPALEELNLPPVLRQLTEKPRGFILVTGPTGSGKSTTLASMINIINEERDEHILTIEDPIEFVHEGQKSAVTQREVGQHTESFAAGLRAALRESPDVLVLGEMRDLETVNLALQAAETGVLVFGTLHTNNAPKTVDRIIDTFPTDQQGQVRTMLSESLAGIVSQLLLRTKDGNGRVAVHEILLKTAGLPNIIREGNTPMLHSIIQAGKGMGMQSMDDALHSLAKAGTIDGEEAFHKATDKRRFEEFVKQ